MYMIARFMFFYKPGVTVPGLKMERAWVGDAPHAMRDPLGLKAGVYKACGLEIKDGGAPVRRRIAGVGRSAMPGPLRAAHGTQPTKI